jgi:hypothetical protein
MKRFPMAHKVNTSHPYTRSEATDIRKTFARARKAQPVATLPAKPAPAPVEPSANVRTLRKVKP